MNLCFEGFEGGAVFSLVAVLAAAVPAAVEGGHPSWGSVSGKGRPPAGRALRVSSSTLTLTFHGCDHCFFEVLE